MLQNVIPNINQSVYMQITCLVKKHRFVCLCTDIKMLNEDFNPEEDAETKREKFGENILSVVKNK